METTREGNMTRPVLRQLLSNMLCYGLTFVDNTPANLEGTMAATGIISFPQVHLLPIHIHTNRLLDFGSLERLN